MSEARKIESEVLAAQKSSEAADGLIERYLPFIRSETAKFLGAFPAEGQDELSIAMTAFYECILAYEPGRGAFLHLASAAIRNRLIDFSRKERRHRNQVSLDAPGPGEEDAPLAERLPAEEREAEKLPERLAARGEIAEFSAQLREFGISLADVAAACPRQERTMEACMAVLRFARENPRLLEELVQTKRLPLAQLVRGAGVERKTAERHRKYLVAILLAFTNGYEIIRGHLRGIGTGEGRTK